MRFVLGTFPCLGVLLKVPTASVMKIVVDQFSVLRNLDFRGLVSSKRPGSQNAFLFIYSSCVCFQSGLLLISLLFGSVASVVTRSGSNLCRSLTLFYSILGRRWTCRRPDLRCGRVVVRVHDAYFD